MNFTPLVSPAVTPLDTQFRLPEYTMPGEYFSPLTSPALEAQNQQHAMQRSVYGAIRGSDTSDTTSPIDMNIDLNLDHSASIAAPLRKSRRKTTTSKPKVPARVIRQSPAMKPQARKKQSPSTIIPPKEVSEIIEDAQKAKQYVHNPPANGKLSLPSGQDSSGADSVSPEPLSEALMPPPATPRPKSAGRSPYIKANQAGSPSTSISALRDSPATPASLMRIQKPSSGRSNNNTRQSSSLKEQASIAEAEMEQILEDIALPEKNKSTKPTFSPLDIAMSNDSDTTPTMPARNGTSSAAPISAPLTATSTVFPSPQLGAIPSPSGSVSSKRIEPKTAARINKKRNSTSQVSPALRPRISPSIKPLLPEGSMSPHLLYVQLFVLSTPFFSTRLTLKSIAPLSTSTTTLLLASKSNYQNILEGTNLPGVSYPSTLASNLTSKRTSHKIAEQGRRNRINLALGEIAALLPAGMGGGAGDDGEGPSGGGGVGGNSKARTVEAAIQYIKMLKGEVKELRSKLDGVDGKVSEKESDGKDDMTPGEATGEISSQGLSEGLEAGQQESLKDLE